MSYPRIGPTDRAAPVITGFRDSNTLLASLLTGLASEGWIVDQSVGDVRSGTVYWTGDYSTGNWEQYNGAQAGNTITPAKATGWDQRVQINGNSSLLLQSAIARPGYTYAAKFSTAPATEVQQFIATGATSGTFTLSWGGSTSAAIAYNANATTVQTALNAMSSIISAGLVTVHGIDPEDGTTDPSLPNNKMYILFRTPGARAAFTANSGSLVGGTVVITQGDDSGHQAAVNSNWTTTWNVAGQDTYYGMSIYVPSSNSGNFQPSWYTLWEVQTAGTPFWGQVLEIDIGAQANANIPGASATTPYFFAFLGTDSSGNATYPASQYWWDTTPITWNTWYDFVVRIKWAADATGVFELWRNGVKVYSLFSRTLPASNGSTDQKHLNYHAVLTAPLDIYFTALRIGDSYSAVAP